MGVVWYAVNLDKCERVDAKRMGEPPTWAGWVNDLAEGENPSDYNGQPSLTRRWVHALIDFGHWSYTDEVRLVSTEPEEGPARSVAWLGPITDRVADYIGPEWANSPALWEDAPHPSTLTAKAPAPTLVPADEEPLVMPADGPIRICNCADRTPRPADQHQEGCAYNPRKVDPLRAVEELLASHPGPWRIEWGTDGADAVRVLDPLGQVVAVMPGRYLAAAQLLVGLQAVARG